MAGARRGGSKRRKVAKRSRREEKEKATWRLFNGGLMYAFMQRLIESIAPWKCWRDCCMAMPDDVLASGARGRHISAASNESAPEIAMPGISASSRASAAQNLARPALKSTGSLINQMQ